MEAAWHLLERLVGAGEERGAALHRVALVRLTAARTAFPAWLLSQYQTRDCPGLLRCLHQVPTVAVGFQVTVQNCCSWVTWSWPGRSPPSTCGQRWGRGRSTSDSRKDLVLPGKGSTLILSRDPFVQWSRLAAMDRVGPAASGAARELLPRRSGGRAGRAGARRGALPHHRTAGQLGDACTQGRITSISVLILGGNFYSVFVKPNLTNLNICKSNTCECM